jgi:hypothetical protein
MLAFKVLDYHYDDYVNLEYDHQREEHHVFMMLLAAEIYVWKTYISTLMVIIC